MNDTHESLRYQPEIRRPEAIALKSVGHQASRRRLRNAVRLMACAVIVAVVAGCDPWPGQNFGLGAGGQVGINNPNATYVTMIQEELGNCTFCYVPATGYFDQATKNATVAFQKNHGIPQTGVVDSYTWVNLFDPRQAIKPLPLYGSGHSTEYTGGNCSELPSSWVGGSGIHIAAYPGIALNHGALGHLYLVAFFDPNWHLITQGLLPMIDGMASTSSTVDVNLKAFQSMSIPCNNYNVSVYGPL